MELNTVIIPIKGDATPLSRQLKALLNQQEAPEFELVISDNGSPNLEQVVETANIREQVATRIVAATQRAGAGFARNVAARHAQGANLLFCDADDEVAPDWVRLMVPQPGRISWGQLLPHLRGEPAWWGVDEADQPVTEIHHPDLFPGCPPLGGGNMGISRELFLKLRGFDTRFLAMEDAEFGIRAFKTGVKFQRTAASIKYHLRDDPTALRRQWGRYAQFESLIRIVHQDAPWDTPGPDLGTVLLRFPGLVKRRLLRQIDAATFAQQLGRRLGLIKGEINYRFLNRIPAPQLMQL